MERININVISIFILSENKAA